MKEMASLVQYGVQFEQRNIAQFVFSYYLTRQLSRDFCYSDNIALTFGIFRHILSLGRCTDAMSATWFRR